MIMNTHVLIVIAKVIVCSRAVRPIDVYWNISNPIFSGGYGADYQNIIEVNKNTHPWEYDQVRYYLQSLYFETTIFLSLLN